MIKVNNWFVAVTLALFVLSACQNEIKNESTRGKLSLHVAVDGSTIIGSISRSSFTDIEVPDVSEFSLLLMQDEEEIVRIERLGDGEETIELPIGTYKAIVYYGDVDSEGFNSPCFKGYKDITILPEQTNAVNITCSLANTLLSFEYSDVFTSYFSHFTTTVKTAKGNSILVNADESRYLYVAPGVLSITMDLTRQGGETGYEAVKLVVVDNASVDKKTHYNFRFDVNAGGEMLTIAFDDEVVMQPIDIATINAAAPKFTLTGVAQGETLHHPESADKELTALLSAVSGVKKVNLKMQSAYLANLGIPQTEIDLTDSANKEIIKQLSSIGLEIRGLTNLDKMIWFDFSKLIPQLQCVGSDSEHLFAISVVDNIGKTCEDLSFSIFSVNNSITVSAIDHKTWNVWDELAYLTLQTTGDVAKIKAYLLNESSKKEIAMNSQSLSNDTYQVELSLPGTVGNAIVSFELGSSTEQLSLTPFIPAYTLELANNLAVWAKKAHLRLKSTDAETEKKLVKHLSFVAAEQALSYYEEGEEIVLTGLTPATNYVITPQCAGIANSNATLAFTTEEALQVPNGGMEDWYYTRPNNVKYWEVWYAAKEGETSVWNTLNLKTTSEGGTNTGAFAGSNRNGCRYNANSGTIQTEDRYSGEYAALIRAVGWGKGNSAVNSANAKYGDPGYLYLGSYNSDTQLPNYDGIPFSSRPTSLSYYYKYTPGKDGDSYLAEIALLHKNGDEIIEIGRGIARGSEEIVTYQQVTLPIEYNEQAAYYKPTHIHLLFKSGDRADNSSFLTVPAFGNLSTGEYIGSQLYIDEIKLNY